MYIGIDPDLHCTGLAVVSLGEVLWVGIASVPRQVKGNAAAAEMSARIIGAVHGMRFDLHNTVLAAVEGQHVSFRTPDPSSILGIAHVTGAAVAVLQSFAPDSDVVIVNPHEWKGQVPKQIHQRRTLEKLGWPYETHGTSKNGYAAPSSPPVGADLRTSDWKHVVDAIGLAMWAEARAAAGARRARLDGTRPTGNSTSSRS